MAPRDRQRARTRQAILDAVAGLLEAGITEPTVDEIVAAADTSRATFYRYFPSPAEALWHVFADLSLPPTEDVAKAGDDPEDRIAEAESAVNGYLFTLADATRAFERAMLERSLSGRAHPHDRPARRLQYIDVALEPIADLLDPHDLFLIRHALALTMGSSVVPALLDTCGLDADQAREVTAFAARTLIREAIRRASARQGPPSARLDRRRVPS